MKLQVNAQVSADFLANKTEGCGSLAGVQFTDQSSGNITSWEWQFGNGNTSTLQNPTASYTSANSYTVRLIVSDGTTKDTMTKVSYINVYQGPSADFTFTPQTGCSPLPVSFTSTSTAGDSPITNYEWDYGDGSQPGTGVSTVHTYTLGGSKTPALEITDQNGCIDTEVKNSAVVVTQAPVANFSTSNSAIHCSAPYTVNFINSSTGSNLSYRWDFGDGNTSTQVSPSHTYTSLGQYDVRLIVSDPNCKDTIFKAGNIKLENPSASFTMPNDYFCYGDTLKLANTSTGTSTYAWSFSSGGSSNLRDPSKVLLDTGFIEITLNALSSPQCFDVFKDTIYVEQLISGFSTDTTLSCLADTINFSAFSNFQSTYEWRIQQFELASDTFYVSPIKVPSKAIGTFSDTLITTSNFGCKDTVIKKENRRVTNSLAGISINHNYEYTNTLFYSDNKFAGCLPLEPFFSDSSSSPFPIIEWNWEFQNKGTSTLEDPGQYIYSDRDSYLVSLIIKDSLGCKDTAEVSIQGGNKATPDFTLLSDTVCPNDSIHIIDNTVPQGNIDSFYFYFSNPMETIPISVDTPDINAPNDINIGFNTVGMFNISLRVSDNGCQSTVAGLDSIYLKGPVAEISFYADCPERRKIVFDSDIIRATSFYWDFGDGDRDSTNEDPSHIYDSLGTYYAKLVLFNDTNGCDSNFYEVEVKIEPMYPNEIRPDSLQFCYGDYFEFYNYDSIHHEQTQWFLDSTLIHTGNKLSINFDSTGTFLLTSKVEDYLGCVFEDTDTLFVNQPIAQFGSNYLNQCAPIRIDFFDSSKTDTTIGKWTWRFGDYDTSYNARDTIRFPGNTQTDLFFKIEDIFGCADSVTIKDFFSSEPLVVNFRSSNTNICVGENITFRNTSSGLNPIFTWNYGDGTTVTTSSTGSVSHTFDSAGVYTVTLTAEDDNGCIINNIQSNLIRVDSMPIANFIADTMQAPCPPLDVNFKDLSIGGVNQWLWTISPSNDSFGIKNPFKKFTEPGSYNIQLEVSTQNGCKDTIQKPNFIVVGGPRGSFSFDKEIACINEVIKFELTDSSGGISSINWDFGGGFGADSSVAFHAYDTTGKVFPTLILGDTNGCPFAVRDSIIIYDVYSDFILEDDSVCQPFNTIFVNTSEGATTYDWQFGDGTSSAEENPAHSYPNTGLYEIELRVTSNQGCLDTARKTLQVLPRALAQLNDTLICSGDTIDLLGTGGTSFKWAPDRILSDTLGALVRAFPDTNEVIQLIVNNNFNCPDTTSMNLDIQQEPNPFQLQDTSLIIGEEVSYDVYAGSGFLYLWTPSEGVDCDTCPKPSFSPLVTTPYTLQVYDAFGCYNLSREVLIEIIEKYSLDVPSAFSPNGDGVNDIIYPRGWGLKELISFKIYNRFGELVFESQDFGEGWDGTYRGKDQNIETYVYTVEALTFGGKVLTKKGNISLIR